MKFVSLAATILACTFPVFVQTYTLTHDATYDNQYLSLTAVACSNGANGLITKGYEVLGDLPNFPYVGGAYSVTGWNSTECGTCYDVCYGDKSVYVLAVDTAANGFNVAEAVMFTLAGWEGIEGGHIAVTSTQVDPFFCGLW